MTEFAPIVSWEQLPVGMARKLAEAGWPIIEGRIAESFGAGKVDANTKAVWTEDGRRITVSMGGGVFILSQSKEPDPIYAEAYKNGHPANKIRSESK